MSALKEQTTNEVKSDVGSNVEVLFDVSPDMADGFDSPYTSNSEGGSVSTNHQPKPRWCSLALIEGDSNLDKIAEQILWLWQLKDVQLRASDILMRVSNASSLADSSHLTTALMKAAEEQPDTDHDLKLDDWEIFNLVLRPYLRIWVPIQLAANLGVQITAATKFGVDAESELFIIWLFGVVLGGVVSLISVKHRLSNAHINVETVPREITLATSKLRDLYLDFQDGNSSQITIDSEPDALMTNNVINNFMLLTNSNAFVRNCFELVLIPMLATFPILYSDNREVIVASICASHLLAYGSVMLDSKCYDQSHRVKILDDLSAPSNLTV